ncbi:MAG: hypothetical protein OSB09_11930 [Planctomycetota bacterium]|nr:hypothetical protein [Planctomycetota bacterium]
MNKSQKAGAVIVGLTIFFIVAGGPQSDATMGENLGAILLITAVLHLLWQTVMSCGTDVEPLDFLPGTVLLFSGFLFLASQNQFASWSIPLALALVVGLGVMMRPFGPALAEEDDED